MAAGGGNGGAWGVAWAGLEAVAAATGQRHRWQGRRDEDGKLKANMNAATQGLWKRGGAGCLVSI